MTQGERTATIKKALKWLSEKKEGVSVGNFLFQIETEITEMGATRRTSRSYIDALRDSGLIQSNANRLKISEMGKKWLEAHQ